MSLGGDIKSLFSYLLGLLFPVTCPACGRVLPRGEKTLCLECWWDMPLTRYWLRPENHAVELLAGRFPFTHASSLFFFESHSRYRTLVHSFKYGSRRDVAQALGEMYGRELSQSPLYQGVDVLVPIPLHWSKRIRRGYNQAEEICLGMQRSMPGTRVEFGALKRTRATRTQAQQKGRKARWENVGGAFVLRHPEHLEGCRVMIVDDVLTTGATIEAAALAIIARLPDAKIDVATLAIVRR